MQPKNKHKQTTLWSKKKIRFLSHFVIMVIDKNAQGHRSPNFASKWPIEKEALTRQVGHITYNQGEPIVDWSIEVSC